MSLSIVRSRANIGIEAPQVCVEVHLSGGLPGFSIVGLPEMAVKESKERVRSAILNSRFEFPDKRITVNLAPADLPKSGGRFDLAIALGILSASGQVPAEKLESLEVLGELALSGEVRPVRGVLPGVLAAGNNNRAVIIHADNGLEAGLARNVTLYTCKHLLEVCAWLQGEGDLGNVPAPGKSRHQPGEDFSDIIGQEHARRAIVLAAAGGHNMLMKGPPGTGKTMLASRIPSIMPALSEVDALEVAAIRSIAARPFLHERWQIPPFRAPHHTASAVALVGGGSTLRVGEISLAHKGVLFLDELPEFSPKVLEVMREPMESGAIAIARAAYQIVLPARFQLVAAMNPCPCGYYGDPEQACRCTEDRVRQYQQRISGPLIDRIDIHIDVPRLRGQEKEQLLSPVKQRSPSSDVLRERVLEVRHRQQRRTGKLNAELTSAEIREHCSLAGEDELFMGQAMDRFRLTTRGFFKILKLARTIADLDGGRRIQRAHLMEAISYRCSGIQPR